MQKALSRASLVLGLVAMAGLTACGTMGAGGNNAASGAATTGYFGDRLSDSERAAGRNWNVVDTNQDGYISAAEMEFWLSKNKGPAAK